MSCGVLWEVEGARLGGLHAELGNRGPSYLILVAWGSGNGLRGGRTRGTDLRIHMQELDTRHVSGCRLATNMFDRGVWAIVAGVWTCGTSVICSIAAAAWDWDIERTVTIGSL